ncbi:MAG TPA: pitrilysin family protein [Vicinamibacterales bacterium]
MTAVDRSRLPEVGPDPGFRLPDVARHTLANGLAVRTIEHTSVPVITIVVQVDGGTGADPADREGLAAITADMVDEGTGTLSALDVSDALARIGGEYDVDVGPDATVFMLTTLTRFAARGTSLLGDLVIRPSLRDADFDRVRHLRLDRLRQLKDLPPAVAERAFLRMLYGTHPYGHLALGNDRALRAMRVEETARFHAATFQPHRATVIAGGALSHRELFGVVDGAFGAWTGAKDNGHIPTAAAAIEPTARPPRLAVVAREGAAQSELRIGHLSARRNTPDYSALLVMNAVLGGQFVSRINLKLREEKGYTYGARTGFDWHRGLAPFSMQSSVHTAATADAIRDSLNEIDAIRGRRPVTEHELVLAKASLTRGYPRNFETAQQVVRGVAQLALYDLPDTYFEEFVPSTNAVTTDDVTRVATQYLDPGRVTTLVVGDHAAIDESLRGLGLGEPQLLPPDPGQMT